MSQRSPRSDFGVQRKKNNEEAAAAAANFSQRLDQDISELLSSGKFEAHDYIESLCDDIYKLFADGDLLDADNMIFSIKEKLEDRLKDVSEINNTTLKELAHTEHLFKTYNKENSNNFLKIIEGNKTNYDQFIHSYSQLCDLSESFDELYEKIKIHLDKNVKVSYTLKVLKLLDYVQESSENQGEHLEDDGTKAQSPQANQKFIDDLNNNTKTCISNICQALNINIYLLFDISSFLINNKAIFQELNMIYLFTAIASVCEKCYSLIEDKMIKAYDNKLYNIVKDCSHNAANYILYESTLRKISEHVIEEEFAKFDLNYMGSALKQLSLWLDVAYRYFKYPEKLVKIFFQSLFIKKIYSFIDFKKFESSASSQLYQLISFANNFKILKEFVSSLKILRSGTDLTLIDELMHTNIYQQNVQQYLRLELLYYQNNSVDTLTEFYKNFADKNSIKYDTKKDLNSLMSTITYSYTQQTKEIEECIISTNCCKTLIAGLHNLLIRIKDIATDEDILDVGMKALEIFKTYLIEMHFEKGLNASLRYDYNRSRKHPIDIFVSLTGIQTAGKVIKSLLVQLGEKCIKMLDGEIRVSFVKIINEYITYLGNVIQHSLKKFFAIYRTSIQNILLSNQISRDFLTEDLFTSSTLACQKANLYIEKVVNQVKNSIVAIPNNSDILLKLGYLTFEILLYNIKNFKYTCMGAAQLNCDIKEYQNVAKIFESPKIMNFFDSLTYLTVILLVSSDNLPSVLEDDQLKVFDSALLKTIRLLRKDGK
ncbi:MAG: Exocyst complex component 5 [Marteilia pararefringens]